MIVVQPGDVARPDSCNRSRVLACRCRAPNINALAGHAGQLGAIRVERNLPGSGTHILHASQDLSVGRPKISTPAAWPTQLGPPRARRRNASAIGIDLVDRLGCLAIESPQHRGTGAVDDQQLIVIHPIGRHNLVGTPHAFASGEGPPGSLLDRLAAVHRPPHVQLCLAPWGTLFRNEQHGVVPEGDR